MNNYGDQIGSDLVVPGLTSFDRLHTVYDTSSDAYRVELDYTVADPNGGTQVEGLIYDTSPTGDYATLSGGGEWVGTPFDDTFIDAAGSYTINGGGGQDYFQINQDSDEVAVSFAARRLLAVSSYDSTTRAAANLTGNTTLIGFTTINLNDQSITEFDDHRRLHATERPVRLDLRGKHRRIPPRRRHCFRQRGLRDGRSCGLHRQWLGGRQGRDRQFGRDRGRVVQCR